MKPTKLAKLGIHAFTTAAVLLLAGCSIVPQPQADPTRYYVLSGAELPADGEVRRPEGRLTLGLRAVEVSPYLNGKEIVVRTGENEVAFQAFSRWAEPLEVSVGRLVAARLASSDAVRRVYRQPFAFEARRDYDLTLRIARCEGVRRPDGATAAEFACSVELTEPGPGGALVWRRRFVAPEAAWDGRDFGQLARALSGQIEALADEVLATLPDA